MARDTNVVQIHSAKNIHTRFINFNFARLGHVLGYRVTQFKATFRGQGL